LPGLNGGGAAAAVPPNPERERIGPIPQLWRLYGVQLLLNEIKKHKFIERQKQRIHVIVH